MSADLLAELDSYYKQQSREEKSAVDHSSPLTPQTPSTTSASSTKPSFSNVDHDDDEDWGEFAAAPPKTIASPNICYSPNVSVMPVTRTVRADTLHMLSNQLIDLNINTTLTSDTLKPISLTSTPRKEQKSRFKPLAKTPGTDLLFDADELNLNELTPTFPHGEVAFPHALASPVSNDEDVFGQFQQSEPSPPKTNSSKPASVDLSVKARPTLKVRTPTGDIFGDVLSFRPKPADDTPTPITAWPCAAAEESVWSPFVDSPRTQGLDDWNWEAEPSVTAVAPSDKPNHDVFTLLPIDHVYGPPMTNIPPPSILLSLARDLLDPAKLAFFQGSTASVDHALRVSFLQGYLHLATATAHVMAGRKQRWLRDKFLSKRMTISAAGGARGMKLNKMDKSQAIRDDSETSEIVALWSKQVVGRLRSLVSAANRESGRLRTKGALVVPDVGGSLDVSPISNFSTDAHPCLVCGLKRGERVSKVDLDVEDSFGEWWVDHWGHRTCASFWLQHKDKLK